MVLNRGRAGGQADGRAVRTTADEKQANCSNLRRHSDLLQRRGSSQIFATFEIDFDHQSTRLLIFFNSHQYRPAEIGFREFFVSRRCKNSFVKYHSTICAAAWYSRNHACHKKRGRPFCHTPLPLPVHITTRRIANPCGHRRHQLLRHLT